MNTFIFEYSWLIVALPFISFLFLAFTKKYTEKFSGYIGTLFMLTAFGLALKLGHEYNLIKEGLQPGVAWSAVWLDYGQFLTVKIGVFIDPISVLMLLIVTGVSSLVHIFSIGYMKGEQGIPRYFTFLSLFTFSMLGLVVAPNIMQMFVFWELVGVSSFLLISFYYKKPEAKAASKKAFIVTRFADFFFMVGILILGYSAHKILSGGNFAEEIKLGLQAFDFNFLNNKDVLLQLKSMTDPVFGMSILTVGLLLVFLGAAGKSAMFPFHVWLPDAMAGPTPVSALIHAATMVVAGIYLVARLFPAFQASGDALDVVAFIGAFTCLFAALIACTQGDIKKVLAYSTLSQLGYMMLSLGVGTAEGYSASIFHLFTHACFKALLFLGAGAIIHGVHSNNIDDMGGLRKKMPITHITFLIATLAISGVPMFSGFFSKDMILLSAYDNGNMIVFGVALFVAALTAFYMFRIYIRTFLGEARTDGAKHAHEVDIFMKIPLAILAFMSIASGYLHVENWVAIGVFKESHNHHLVTGLATSAGVIGIIAAFVIYKSGTEKAEKISKLMGPLYKIISNKFYIDELYTFFVKFIFEYISRPIAWFDRNIVDKSMDIAGSSVFKMGAAIDKSQTGKVQTYVVWVLNGVVIIALLLLLEKI